MDPMAVDMAGATPAHEAARLGNVEALRVIQRGPGVDITAPGSIGRTPLFYAAMRGFRDVIAMIVDGSSAVPAPSLPGNRRDVYGASPITAAARNGHRSTVTMLLALDPGSASEVDREGRGIAWWPETCGCEPPPELTAGGTPIGSARDVDQLVGMLKQDHCLIDDEDCYCDVCTRYTVHGGRASC